MKIVFLQDDFPPFSVGGAGFSVYELARKMSESGHETFVIASTASEENVGESEMDGVRVVRVLSRYPTRLRSYISLNNIPVVKQVEDHLRTIRPDVVHINNVHVNLSYRCFKVAKKYSRAVFFTARDTMAVGYGKLDTKRYIEKRDPRLTWWDNIKQAKKAWNPLRNVFIRNYLSYPDRIFAVSDSLREALVRNGIKNVKTLHTGEDITKWQATQEEKETFIARLGLEGKKVVLFGGRLSEGKGGRKAVESMAHLKVHPDVVLLVAGKMDLYAERMKELAKKLGVEDKLMFTGWVSKDDMRAAYAAADVVLVPSLYLDPFPRIVIEAMAAGCPVVGTCYGGAPEIILDGETGYVVNPFKTRAIAERIATLLENKILATRFGEAGRLRIKNDFNLEDAVGAYIVEYQSVLKRNLELSA